MLGEIFCHSIKGARALSRNHQQLLFSRSAGRFRSWRLFDYHMRIRPSRAEGADTGPSRCLARGPIGEFGIDKKWRVREIDLRICQCKI